MNGDNGSVTLPEAVRRIRNLEHNTVTTIAFEAEREARKAAELVTNSRIEDIEDDRKWFRRLIVGAFLTLAVQVVVALYVASVVGGK